MAEGYFYGIVPPEQYLENRWMDLIILGTDMYNQP